jgi:phosphatidylserine/phosphatidylglycerophosphate/cardiolipin synthase-like enzyme
MKIKTRLAGLLIALSVFTALNLSEAFEVILSKETPVRILFSPQGGCTEGIVKVIDRARSEILVQAHSLTSVPLYRALLRSHERGVKIALIADKSERTEGLTPALILANAGIPVYLDGKHAVANNRVVIVDQQVVITGSFNFNQASEDMNAENLLILDSKEVAAEYRKNWFQHRQHSEPY